MSEWETQIRWANRRQEATGDEPKIVAILLTLRKIRFDLDFVLRQLSPIPFERASIVLIFASLLLVPMCRRIDRRRKVCTNVSHYKWTSELHNSYVFLRNRNAKSSDRSGKRISKRPQPASQLSHNKRRRRSQLQRRNVLREKRKKERYNRSEEAKERSRAFIGI